MARRFAYLDGTAFFAFAHRGGTIDHPENTLEAFQSAIDLGFEYIETDVHASLDGELYAFHDNDLERVVGIPASIGELTSREVDAIRFGGGYRVPRFDEVVLTWPTIRLNIDPKADAALVPLVKAIDRHAMIDRVCIGSFSDRRIAWCRAELGEDLCTSMGPLEIMRLWFCSQGLPTEPPTAPCAQLPTKQKLLGRYKADFTSEQFVETVHDLGLFLHIWTIDEEPEMHRLVDAGVDGIMTDRPDVLRKVLIERGRWTTDPHERP